LARRNKTGNDPEAKSEKAGKLSDRGIVEKSVQNPKRKIMENPYVAPRIRPPRIDADEHYLEAIRCKDIEIHFEPEKVNKLGAKEKDEYIKKWIEGMKCIRKMKERIYG